MLGVGVVVSWSANGGGSAYSTAGVLAVEVASRESSRWEGREGKERKRDRKKERERDGHEAPVEEALYTGWILVRPSVSRPISRYRHREQTRRSSKHRQRSRSSEPRKKFEGEEIRPFANSHFTLTFSSVPWKKDKLLTGEGLTIWGSLRGTFFRETVLGRVRS